MKALLAILTVVLFLQMAWGKQSQQLRDKLARASKELSVVAQAVDHKSSRVARQTMQIGSCDSARLERFASGYPEDCALRFLELDLAGIVANNPSAFQEFVVVFCEARCGQPIVNLFFDCDLAAIASVLVYTCQENGDGDTCGSIIDTFTSTGTAADDNCLPQTQTCTTACRNSLVSFRDSVGCCANLTNIGNEFGVDIEIDDFTLWDSCGVDVPGLCGAGPLRGAGKAPVVTEVTFVGLAMLAMVVVQLLQ